MDDIDEIRRLNPGAAADLDSIKKAMKVMERLRAVGIAKGPVPLVAPHAGRYGQMPKGQRHTVRAALKMTLRA